MKKRTNPLFILLFGWTSIIPSFILCAVQLLRASWLQIRVATPDVASGP
jgi:hypothetical protein